MGRSLAPPVMTHHIAGDAEQPGTSRLPVAVKGRTGLIGRYPNLRQQVFGSLDTRPAGQVRVDQQLVPAQDLSEGVAVSVDGPVDELCVGLHQAFCLPTSTCPCATPALQPGDIPGAPA